MESGFFATGLAPHDFSMDALCRRMFERNKHSIRVQKDHVAVAKLTLIVDATLELSLKLGFGATSLRHLSNATGMSMGSLYMYFETKEHLAAMILEEVSTIATEVLSAPPAGVNSSPVDHLQWLIATHLELTELMHKWFVFAFMEAKYFPKNIRRAATDSELATENLFVEVLKHGQGNKAFAIDDPGVAASFIKPLLQDWYVKRAKHRRRGVSLSQYTSEVSAFVMRAICPAV